MTPVRRYFETAALGAFLMLLASGRLEAHDRSESFSHWRYSNGALSGVIMVRSREVTRLTLPGEGFGSLTQIFRTHVEKSITAATNGQACVATHPARLLDSEPGFIRVGVDMQCPPGDTLEIRVTLLFEVAPTHDHFIYVESASGAAREAILTVSSPSLDLQLKPSPAQGARFIQFIQMGIEHIATGIDHLAFLLALLLTARNPRQVLLIVTGFTIGHSLTLSLAVAGLVQANRTAVEALIGLTIALAAAANLVRGEREGRFAALGAALIPLSVLLIPAAARPDMPPTLLACIAWVAASFVWLNSTYIGDEFVKARFAMAIGFGLVHGLGFASALQDLHLPRRMLVPTLVGFNIGVEIGQLAAVILAVALYRGAARLWPAARRSDTPALALSAALLAIGTAWFLTRTVTSG